MMMLSIKTTMARNHARAAAFSTSAQPPLVPPRYRTVRKFLGRAARGPLTVLGLVAVSALAIEYKTRKDVAEDAKGDKKRVLVLPFHRMKLVETKRPNFSARARESVGAR